MNLNPIRANMTELDLGNGTRVLFSYRTPVASAIGDTLQITEKRWSNTTSRHINQWLKLQSAGGFTKQPQEFFDNLIAGVK